MRLGVLFAVKQQFEIRRLIFLEILLHHFFAVIGLRAVRLHHSQRILQTYLGTCRIVILIGCLLIHNLLDFRILRGLDGQAAVVYQIISLLGGVSLDLLQIVDHLRNGRVHIIGIDACAALGLIGGLNAVIDVIRHGLLIFFLADITAFFHIIQYNLTPLGILLRICNRIVLGGALGDTRDNRSFRDTQFADVLIEIAVGCRLNTQSILS